MPNMLDYYEYAKLASAAYVQLEGVTPGATYSGDSVAALANFQNDTSRLPSALANQTFISDPESNPNPWVIQKDGYHGNDPSGFAATLLERSGQKVLAIRGTEPSANWGQDLFQADLAGIGILGLAVSQTVEMINFIRRLTTPAGQTVERLELHSSATIPGVPSVKAAGVLPGQSVYFYCTTTQDTGLGLIGPNEKIIVTGHSLGGHLAALATRLFPSVVSEAYLYNAPGFDPTTASYVPGSRDLFTAALASATGPAALLIKTNAQQLTEAFVNLFDRYLGYGAAGSFGEIAGLVHNLESEDIAPGNDASGVSSILTGAQNLPAETFIPTERNSHMIEPFMDSLSMQAVLYRLKPEITTGQIETLFQAVSVSDADVLEKLVVSLRNLLIGDGPPLTKTADALGLGLGLVPIGTGDISARRDYYSVLLEVEKVDSLFIGDASMTIAANENQVGRAA